MCLDIWSSVCGIIMEDCGTCMTWRLTGESLCPRYTSCALFPKCGDLNENGLPRFIYQNSGSPDSRTIVEGLEGVSVLE